MKKSQKLAVLGASLVSLLVVACQPGGGSATVDDSPEAVAFRYRQGLMRGIAWKVAQLRGMAQGDITVDETSFKKHATDLATLAGMIPEGFIPNSGDIEGSAALPDVWANWNDFQTKAREFQTAAQGLADTANNSGFAAAQGMVQGVGQQCGNCHRPYRRRDDGE
jgi:cytochrome c556